MKKSFGIIALAIVMGITTGCKEEKKSESIIVKKIEHKAPSGPIAMQEYTQATEAEWGGETVVCEISRKPDASLPMVSNENGQKFVDNRITLKISYQNGGVILDKTFTKSDFNSALDDDYRRTGVLEGLVYDKMEGGKMKFAASVSHPQTDEYIPIVLQVSKNGSFSVSRDTQMDTSGEDDFNS